MKHLAVLILVICVMAFSCKGRDTPDPRSTCGPKVPLSECIK